MFARVVWKLVVGLSVILAITLAALWLRTLGSGPDVVVSGARGGTYRELRFGGGRVGVTLVPRWPVDERLRAGRVAPRKEKDVYLPASRIAPSSTGTSFLPLLDGSRLTLQTTTPASWLAWPPARSSGPAYVEGALEKHFKFSGSFASTAMSARGTNTLTAIILPSTAPTSAATTGPTGPTGPTSPTNSHSTVTFSGSGVVTIVPPTTSPASTATTPTLVVGGQSGGVAAATANAVTATLRNANLTFRTAPVPTTLPAVLGGNSVTFSNVYLVPTYAFERYAIPLLPLIVVVLLPAWIALAASWARTMRRGGRRRKGLCESCGYDLRGSPAGAACPECGSANPVGPVAPSGDALIARLR